ncbi:hypothetical protein [Kitasatospora sp. NPDC101183]|uniref:hypothetical protein n=1 Tax=Kitasatospora sp. NPDC101183 TaxID=3364100 RepID=UPI00382F4B0D
MKTLRALTVSAAALALTAATVTTAAAAEAPAISSTIYLTNADNNGTVAAAAGDVIQVDLSAVRETHASWLWVEVPTASVPGVLYRTAGATSPTGDAYATFTAVATGTSDITSYSVCRSDPGWSCPAVLLPWKATVNVT